MAKGTRNPGRSNVAAAIVGIVCALSLVPRPLSADSTAALLRVRSGNPDVRQLIQQGEQHSSSFRALIDELQRTDGLVWVEQGVCRRPVLACLSHNVTVSAGNRMLRVTVHRTRSSDDTIAAIAHELRHATEVLANPAVTNHAGIYFLYLRIGSWTDGVAETDAAVATGETVRAELRAYAKSQRR
jgi:hypothetical protein